jgi:hypothetical protein
VPALSVSFAFGTNADLAALCERGTRHIAAFLTDLLSAHLAHISTLESTSMKRATLFNPVLNTQLCEAPAPGRSEAAHFRYIFFFDSLI